MQHFTAAVTSLLAFVVVTGMAAQTDLSSLLARASAYVETFQRDFGSMVAEERYEQTARQNAVAGPRTPRTAPQRTVLVSDFLLVQVPGEGWLPFRDVFERDGRQVRDREERLASLFLSGSRSAFEQARTIMDESARYNIGNVERNINVPTFPIVFLTAAHRGRFSFEARGRDDHGFVIQFREIGRPTFVRTAGDRDLPARGRFWIDEVGTIRRTEMEVIDTTVEAHITVTYAHDAGSGLWLPARMEERYRGGRNAAEVRGVATYSNFRRFQVTTAEEIVQ